MSITIKSAAATFAAVAFSVAVMSGTALANTKGPSGPSHSPSHPHPGGASSGGGSGTGGGASNVGKQVSGTYHAGKLVSSGSRWNRHSPMGEYCYWLPTVSNGSVSGLKPVCYWAKK